MREAEVIGGGGVRLAVREAGVSGAPVLVLLHGWAQSAQVWQPVLAGPLAQDYRLLAPDLRGHGDSETPPGGYDDAASWAADVAAVLAYAAAPALLVGWSYGGLVIVDYLREYGTGAGSVVGIALVGAITEIGRGHPGGRVGPTMRAALPGALSDDPEVAVPALTGFVAGMAALPGTVAQQLLGTALQVPPRVRAALFDRDVDSAQVLGALDVPALVLHGADDTVVDPRAGAYAASLIPDATAHEFAGTAHLPFHEQPDRFAAVLGDFAATVSAAGKETAREH
ncbi:MAG: alpha/beta fold hydrolase [Sciscionella sp.]